MNHSIYYQRFLISLLIDLIASFDTYQLFPNTMAPSQKPSPMASPAFPREIPDMVFAQVASAAGVSGHRYGTFSLDLCDEQGYAGCIEILDEWAPRSYVAKRQRAKSSEQVILPGANGTPGRSLSSTPNALLYQHLHCERRRQFTVPPGSPRSG